jgi:hypothetical protein
LFLGRNQTIGGTLAVTGATSLSSYVGFTSSANLTAAGQIGRQASAGLTMWAVTGTTYDFLLYPRDGAAVLPLVMTVAANTSNVTFGGAATFSSSVTATNYTTIRNTATIPASSTATILTLSSSVTGVYIVNANFNGQGNNIYGGMLIVVANAGSFRIITNGGGTSSVLSLSGANVQIANALGSSLDATGTAVLIGN